MYTVISPHNDDFVIGCWMLLKSGRVSKAILLQEEEFESFERACDYYDVAPSREINSISKENMVLTPSDKDNHPLHKKANAIVRSSCAFFGLYSTEMNVSWLYELPSELQKKKKKDLDSLFPSKKELWRRNHKYFLFEGHVVMI